MTLNRSSRSAPASSDDRSDPSSPASEPLRRVDSRLDLRTKPAGNTMEDEAPLVHSQAAAAPSRPSAADQQRHPDASEQLTHYLFSHTNPAVPADRDELRGRRRHVMYNFLARGNSTAGRKRRRSGRPADPVGPEPQNLPGHRVPSPLATPALQHQQLHRYRHRPSPFARFTGRYMTTDWTTLPFTVAGVEMGRELNPFDTWPTITGLQINVNALKYSCATRFSTAVMSRYWVSLLLQARHAFLSTICIAAAHDEIMTRTLVPKHSQTEYETLVRRTITGIVNDMITDSLADPRLRTADSTVVAVLQCFIGEILIGDDAYIDCHVRGLNIMVGLRGGLDQLGLQGPDQRNMLACILTIMMFLLAALRETDISDEGYRVFARRHIPEHLLSTTKAENPLTCRERDSYQPFRKTKPYHKIIKMLDRVRAILDATVGLEGTLSREDIQREYDSLEHSEIGNRGKRASLEDKRYEAIRLASVLFAKALVDRVPLSEAARRLREKSFGRTRNQPYNVSVPAIHMQIKEALCHAEISDCWGERQWQMTGVLFWITIVAAASAHQTQGPSVPTTEEAQQSYEGGRWLAAIAVRCAICLGFEQPLTVVGALRRLVGVQRRLDAHFQSMKPAAQLAGPTFEHQSMAGSLAQGPAEPPTMLDIAFDFQSCPPDL